MMKKINLLFIVFCLFCFITGCDLKKGYLDASFEKKPSFKEISTEQIAELESYQEDYFIVVCSKKNLDGTSCDDIENYFSNNITLPYNSSIYFYDYDPLISDLSQEENVSNFKKFLQEYRIKTMPAILHKFKNRNIDQFSWQEKIMNKEIDHWIENQKKYDEN